MSPGSIKTSESSPSVQLAYSQFNSPTPEGFSERLRALEKARSTLLDEKRYQEWRSTIFTDLASPRSFGKSFGVVLYPLTLVALVLAATGYFAEVQPLFFGAGGSTVILALTIAVLAVVSARTRSLTHSQRFQIVDHLLVNSAITQEEATELRARIRDTPLRAR